MKLTEEQQKEAVNLLRILKKDAELALSGAWDRSDSGFKAQIIIIDRFLYNIKPTRSSKKFKQQKLFT